MMFSLLRPAAVFLGLFSLLTGIAYPLALTGLAQAVFPQKANGSLIERRGQVLGSSLIGQPFDDPRYFWGRPSATMPFPYNAGASSGSNLGPSNPMLQDAVRHRAAMLHATGDGTIPKPIPIDLLTSSASGLDPHISPAAALYQVSRVAHARGLNEEDVRGLVEGHIEGRTFGILGEARVNVLQLNLELDGAAQTSP